METSPHRCPHVKDNLSTQDGTVDLKGRPAIKSKTGGRRTFAFILGTQLFASMSYFGVFLNLVLYLTKILHEDNAIAANNVSNWLGTSYFTSLIGAFLGDAYWGKYWTTAIFLIIFLVGTILMTLTATLPSLRPVKCNPISLQCPRATKAQSGLTYISLYIMALGYGAHQPCLTSFGADQFDKEDVIEQSQATSFFSWFYMSLSLGATIAGTLFIYVEDNVTFGVGYGICTTTAALAVVLFFTGTPFYRHQIVGGNPFTRIAQVLVAAIYKFRVQVPKDENLLHELDYSDCAIQGSRKIYHTNDFRFFDKAAIKLDTMEEESANPWRLCTITQVEEVKCVIRMLPIWATNIFFSTVHTQIGTLFVEQGATMNTNIGRFRIPPATLTTVTMATVVLCTPMYEWWVVPIGRMFTKRSQGFTSLQRMGIGMVVIIIGMLCAALVEVFRLESARVNGLKDKGTIPVPMSIFWQLPQYVLMGIAEIFTFIGQLDFFYDQSPDAIRGIGVALSLSSYALGNYLSTIVLSIVTSVTSTGKGTGWISNNLNHGHMDYFYWLLAVLSFTNFVVYLICAHWYKCIKINNIQSDEKIERV